MFFSLFLYLNRRKKKSIRKGHFRNLEQFWLVGQGTTFSLDPWATNKSKLLQVCRARLPIYSCTKCLATKPKPKTQNQPLSSSSLPPSLSNAFHAKAQLGFVWSPWRHGFSREEAHQRPQRFAFPPSSDLSRFVLRIVFSDCSFSFLVSSFLQFSGVCCDIHVRFLGAF
jgi:hypothetical protein